MMSIRNKSSIRFFARAAAGAALGVGTLLLFACGELSMYEILDAEEPGELTMSQSTLNLPPEAEYRLTVTGGFKPYQFQIDPSTGAGVLAGDALYRAPEASQTPAEGRILVTDRLGSTAAATIRVYAPLRALPTSIAVEVGESEEIEIVGGRGAIGRAVAGTGTVSVEDNPDTRTSTNPGRIRYTAPGSAGTGSDEIEITDQYGSSAFVTVTLYEVDELRITPLVKTIQAGDTLELTVLGGLDPIAEATILPPYAAVDLSFSDANRTITFTHPGGGVLDSAHISVTDDSARSAGATVHVIAEDPGDVDELTISPNSGEFTDGTTVEFTASGGVPPYTFERVGPGSGQPVAVGENKARYTVSFPPGAAQIRLTDHTGEHVTAKLNVSK